MVEEKQHIYKFDFLNNFMCDGKYCESRCCRDWDVEIDRVTLAKYRNLEDKRLQKRNK